MPEISNKSEKYHFQRDSAIGGVIAPMANSQEVHDRDLDTCEVQFSECFLSPGIEHLFVSLSSKMFVDHAWANQRLYPFQQLIYSPHTTVEPQGGFDLSVGVFDDMEKDRLRMMHKLITETWCDEEWCWKSDDKRDRKHIVTLARKCNDHRRPFLVIHVCYCVHEYRRMGLTIEGVPVPDFSNPMRTVVVDLRPIRGATNLDALLKEKVEKDETLGVRVECKANGGTRTARFISPNDNITLDVYDFAYLLNQFREIVPKNA